ncbi:MAG: hypothetical protein N4P91_02295 [Candidatus Lightella neohaematopini]|nr:hypothetical protein [Candidatus Lightella neohaematopini]
MNTNTLIHASIIVCVLIISSNETNNYNINGLSYLRYNTILLIIVIINSYCKF